MCASPVNLLGLTRPELEAFFVELGEKPFRARQVMKWIYSRAEPDFEVMTDLSRDLRTRLPDVAEVRAPEFASEQRSSDGSRKWLLRAGGGQAFETVFIPGPSRGTLCISSQVGCALDCSFCSTGQQGFNRNLDVAEIVGQVWAAHRALRSGDCDRPITNVVLMGMGEPLANYRNIVPAVRNMLDDFGFALSRRRVTVSTSGLVPQLDRLGSECNVALAVSLHASNDQLRDRLVPINRRYPIADLLAACWRYAAEQSRYVTFEYVMLDRVNDRPEHARELARLLRRKPAKVNLIPFNTFPGTRYRRSSSEAVARFGQILMDEDIVVTIRRTRGDDIDAACGQLVGRVEDRVRVRLGKKLVGEAV